MEKLISYILLIMILLSSSCDLQNAKSKSLIHSDVFISIDFYPSLQEYGLSILYNGKDSMIFLKPFGKKTLQLSNPPKPPENLESDLNRLQNKNHELFFEIFSLSESQVDKIDSLLNSFEDKDFSSVYNFDVKDGISLNVNIVRNKNMLYSFNLVNGATKQQREFIVYLIDLIGKNTVQNQELIYKITMRK